MYIGGRGYAPPPGKFESVKLHSYESARTKINKSPFHSVK